MLTIESWKPIPGFPDQNFEASRFGEIREIYPSGKSRVLIPTYRDGSYQVPIPPNDLIKSTRVARVVAYTFIENPENLPFVIHVNRITTDNRIENLCWCRTKRVAGAVPRLNVLKNGKIHYPNVTINEAADCLKLPGMQLLIKEIADGTSSLKSIGEYTFHYVVNH